MVKNYYYIDEKEFTCYGYALNYAIKKNRPLFFIDKEPEWNRRVYASREFTENSLLRFHAKKIQCLVCGRSIDKKTNVPIMKRGLNGDFVREWRCPYCNRGFYSENISELMRLGLL